MKPKTFKPILAPNELASFTPTDNPKKFYVGIIKFPISASFKLDGIRCEFYNGEILSRSLKQIQNKQVREKFEPLRKYNEENGVILDGEIYNHGVPFGLISSCVMTQDYEDKKSIQAWEKLCIKHNFNATRKEVFDGLKFYCFDSVSNNDFDYPYIERYAEYNKLRNKFSNDIFEVVEVFTINSIEELKSSFDKVVKAGYEGLILRDSQGRYKFGRGSIKEALIFKVKPYETFDAKIIGVVQSTEVDPNAEKKINELGRSVTSKKKGDRILIEKASGFIVKYNEEEVKPTLSMTDEEKIEVWANREAYIGKMIEYKGMLVGSCEVPRHPTFVRFREDKDE